MNLAYLCCRGLWQKYKLSRYRRIVLRANALADGLRKLSDEQLTSQLRDLKSRAQGYANIKKLLPFALALAREISTRTLNMRPYDVQLLGALTLYEGYICEMDTGEGKTLMAPLTAFLHLLTGVDRSVHIVTANEYLAQRDYNWMSPLYKGLELSVGLIVPQQPTALRVQAYQHPVVYATAREVVFDSMRKSLRRRHTPTVDAILRPQQQDELDPKYDFVIVDEVDSVLIDQARNPISIGAAGAMSVQSELYQKAEQIAGKLARGSHYRLLYDERSVELKDEGKAEARNHAGKILRQLPSGHRWERYITCALAARYIYKRDQHYVVRDNSIILIDESTGRLLPGRQLPDGLHQALETHNGLAASSELRGAIATTFQTFFRKYAKLSGMTGTATIAAREFQSIYRLAIVPIPPNQPRQRNVLPDRVYRSLKSKYKALMKDIKAIHDTNRPLLIGTGSVLVSEHISELLTKHNLEHEVLNAKNHSREAEIIAQAGEKGRITVITNMAGRGVDIVLGDGVAANGGMRLIGTDRMALRRLDDQLIGRIGRQGDPGDCRFYLSCKDDLLIDANRKTKCRLRKKTRQQRDEPIADRAADRLFLRTQRHNDKVSQNMRNKQYRSEKQREKLKDLGLWEDWMDTR